MIANEITPCNSANIPASYITGRDNEIQLLKQAYERSKSTAAGSSPNITPPQELVLVQGNSGTGKTTFAHSVADQVKEDDIGFFLSGKFELRQFRKPYEVFVDAFDKFPSALKVRDASHPGKARWDEICRALRDAVGLEGKLLTDMIPSFKDLIGERDDDDAYCIKGKDILHRFLFVFTKFVRTVSAFVPLVLFFDDLQWSDPLSLSLLQMILETPPQGGRFSSLLVICAFRDEGLKAEQMPIMETSDTLQQFNPGFFNSFLPQVSTSTRINLTDIVLRNLNESNICSLIEEYLSVSSEISQKLAPIIFAKCHGNPFYAVQLLGPLLSHKSEHNHGNGKQLTGADAEIFGISEALGSVDDLICHRISLLPPFVQQVLQSAACIGDSVDHSALCTVFDGNVSAVEHALKNALHKGLLAYESKLGQSRFTHDRFRQAALSTIDDVKAASFRIGFLLWTKSTPLFLSTKMFLVANQLNHGTTIMTDQAQRYGAAAFNLEAGVKAISLAAFPDASRFLQAGIDFLVGGDFWKDEYSLALNLFSVAADAQLCNQVFSKVDELVHQVLENARTVKDKLRAYAALINSLGQRGNIDAAIEVGIEVSKQLGDPLPAKVNDFSILFEILKTKISLRGRSDLALLTLPSLQDEDRIAGMYILTNLVTYTFQVASSYCPVIGARIVRLCLRNGTHK